MATFLFNEASIDPLGCALFDSFFDVKKDNMESWDDYFFDGLELDDISTAAGQGCLPVNTFSGSLTIPEPVDTIKIVRKRKSLEWDSKPLEKRTSTQQKNLTSKFSLDNTVPCESQPIKRKRGRPRKYPIKNEASIPTQTQTRDCGFGALPFDMLDLPATETPSELGILSDLFMASESRIKPVSKQLMKSRKSEDWSFKPQTTTKKRMKWSNGEMQLLWQGISQHGNNWTEIRGMFSSRSYCQIKDKGRRCLFLLGWETGRSKLETDCSSIRAKQLAREVLTKMKY